MDFLIICVFMFIVAVIARFFFKTILVVSLLGAAIYLFSPDSVRQKIDSYVSISYLQSGINSLFSVSKDAATKISVEAKKIK